MAEATELAGRVESLANMMSKDRERRGELQALRGGLAAFRSVYQEDPLAVAVLEKGGVLSAEEQERIQGPADPAQVELAAYTMLMHSLLNLDITKTRQ